MALTLTLQTALRRGFWPLLLNGLLLALFGLIYNADMGWTLLTLFLVSTSGLNLLGLVMALLLRRWHAMWWFGTLLLLMVALSVAGSFFIPSPDF